MFGQVVFPLAVFALAVVGSWAQLRWVASGHSSGVSPVSWTLITGVQLSWAAHQVVLGFWVAAGVNGVLGLLSVAVATHTWRASPRPAPATVVALVVTLTTAAVTAVVVPAVGAWVLSAGVVAMFVPQAVVVVRRRLTGSPVGGVSARTWAINVIISVLWFGWAVSAHHVGSMVANVAVAALASVVYVAVRTAPDAPGTAYVAADVAGDVTADVAAETRLPVPK